MLKQFLWIEGRIGRLQWWLTGLMQLGILLVSTPFLIHDAAAETSGADLATLLAIVVIVLFASWIGLVANIRRYHDRDKSGWWVLFAFVPLIGPLWQFIELGFLAGSMGDNDFGPPIGGGADVAEEIANLRARSGQSGAGVRLSEPQPIPVVAARTTFSPSGGGSFGKRR
jgi:uncharacterized membrane protein YhaH (DUF805 family)